MRTATRRVAAACPVGALNLYASVLPMSGPVRRVEDRAGVSGAWSACGAIGGVDRFSRLVSSTSGDARERGPEAGL